MSEVDVEGTKLVGGPTRLRGGEAKAGWVDDGNDGEGSAAIGQVNAADTSIVLNEHAEIVVVAEALSVSGGLDTLQHESVLLGQGLLNTLLLLGGGNLVLDLTQVELHVLGPVSLAGSRKVIRLPLEEPVPVGVAMVTAPDRDDLFDVEADAGNSQLAMLIVDLDVTFGSLIRHEHVLVENAAHGGSTLITAAPGLDVAGL